MTLALLGAALVLKLWRGSPGIPLSLGGDAYQHLMITKGVLDHGWYLHNSSLGAPFGQDLHDFPVANGDNLTVLMTWVLGLFSNDPALVTNVLFLLGFALAALVAFLVLRQFEVPWGPAVVAAVLFSFLPYHFHRGESHLFLATYWAVPIGAYFVMAVLLGRPLFERRGRGGGSRLLAFASRRSVITVVLAVIVATASGSFYYSSFTVLLVIAATFVSFVARRERATLVTGATVVVVIGAVTLMNLAPTLAYRAQHGPNPEKVGQRDRVETTRYSLAPLDLFLPIDDHRLPPLDRLQARFRGAAIPGLTGGLGLFATAGVLAALVAALAGGLSRLRAPHQDIERLRAAGIGAAMAIALGAFGGGSALIGYYVTAQLRGWNRIIVFVAFFGFLALALGLKALERRLSRAITGAAGVSAGVLIAVLVLGTLDQTAASFAPPYDTTRAIWRSDEAFVRQIERGLDPRAMVFQFPPARFPEGVSQDHVRGFLHSDRLRWSYGSMAGRPENWEDNIGFRSPEEILAAVAVAGFSGIYVDRERALRVFEQRVQKLVGRGALLSPRGDLGFFDIRSFRQRLREKLRPPARARLRAATLWPETLSWGPGFYGLESDDAEKWRWVGQTARLQIEAPTRQRRRLRLTGRAVITPPGRALSGSRSPSMLEIHYPDRSSQRLRIGRRGVRIDHAFWVPPGKSAITFKTDAPRIPTNPADPRELHWRFVDPLVEDTAFRSAARVISGRS